MSGLTGTELALLSDLRREALDAYSVVWEPSRKQTRDHHKAIEAALAAALSRLAAEREHMGEGDCTCMFGERDPKCPRLVPNDEVVDWLWETAERLDPSVPEGDGD